MLKVKLTFSQNPSWVDAEAHTKHEHKNLVVDELLCCMCFYYINTPQLQFHIGIGRLGYDRKKQKKKKKLLPGLLVGVQQSSCHLQPEPRWSDNYSLIASTQTPYPIEYNMYPHRARWRAHSPTRLPLVTACSELYCEIHSLTFTS